MQKVVLGNGVEGRVGTAEEGEKGCAKLVKVRREKGIWVRFG